MHPLYNTAKIEDIIPAFSIITNLFYKQPDFRQELRKTLMAEMQLKISKNEKEMLKDPFLVLGYGINSFFDIMHSLAFMMLFITIFMIPVMSIYAFNDTQEFIKSPMYALNQFTLGNYGGSSMLCQHTRVKS